MGNRFSKIIWMVLVAAFIFTGCQRQYKEEVVDVLDSGPEIDMTSVPPDYVVKSIEAVGGWNAWSRTKELQLDCVVTFYQPDGSFHLTEQHHVVYPWSNSIQISAREPQGRFVWQLSKGKFDVLQEGGQSAALPIVIGSNHFAEMILSIMTIPARFLDESAEFSKETTGLKIQGQWYYPISRLSSPIVGTEHESEPAFVLSKAVLYQDRASSLIDMLVFDFKSGDSNFAVRGYEYTEVEKNGVRVPARIEIFKADARGNLQERLVKIDNHTFKRSK
ncbi:MAG: hypothetical protein FVQ84_06140 [Planctomycetes bacterium]|nr:hypothetical protein [Planctomycetota bacterium]